MKFYDIHFDPPLRHSLISISLTTCHISPQEFNFRMEKKVYWHKISERLWDLMKEKRKILSCFHQNWFLIELKNFGIAEFDAFLVSDGMWSVDFATLQQIKSGVESKVSFISCGFESRIFHQFDIHQMWDQHEECCDRKSGEGVRRWKELFFNAKQHHSCDVSSVEGWGGLVIAR